MHSPDEKKRKKQPFSTRFYELLEVTATADAETLRHSFLRLAKLHHPDRNATTAAAADSSIFREISEAYNVLSNPDLRRAYDAFGDADFSLRRTAQPAAETVFACAQRRNKSKQRPQQFDDAAAAAAAGSVPISMTATATVSIAMLSSVLAQVEQTGGAIFQTVDVSLEALYTGHTQTFSYDRFVRCDRCNGTGSGRLVVCVECGGNGSREDVPCRMCGGDGTIALPQEKCKECSGNKIVIENATVSVNIEAGTHSGSMLHFLGQGNYVPSKKSFGELLVVVCMAEHPLFLRKGSDLLLEARITLREALCGFVLSFPHPSGQEVVLRSPPGKVTRPEDEIIAKGKGMPVQGSNGRAFGHLIVKLHVEFPPDNAFTGANIATLSAVLPEASESMARFVERDQPQPPPPPQQKRETSPPASQQKQ